MTRWRWALLIFELLLIALILVLPQVDLPDYTFHSGTAPVAAKARLSSASSGSNVGLASVRRYLPTPQIESLQDSSVVAGSASTGFLLAMLCTFLC